MAKIQHRSRPWLNYYKTKEWRVLRIRQLRRKPLCEFCEKSRRIVEATVVDHIKPHKGDKALFHDPENLQSLCKKCHDSVKARMEAREINIGCDEDGIVNAWK